MALQKACNNEQGTLSQFIFGPGFQGVFEVLDNFKRAEESYKNSTDTSTHPVGMEKS